MRTVAFYANTTVVKNPESVIAKLAEVAMRRFAMIKDGDRIAVAVSGGKDSTALALDLAMKQRWWPVRYELKLVHIETDMGSDWQSSNMEKLFASYGLSCETVNVPVLARLKADRKMNCYWCSTQRRTELLRYTQAQGCTAIALGHHLDDMVETLVMNMMLKGQMTGMLPHLRYDKYPVRVIRPLALCEERQIIEFAAYKGFNSFTCSCPHDDTSKRKLVRQRIALLTGDSSAAKRRIFESQFNIKEDYLCGEF